MLQLSEPLLLSDIKNILILRIILQLYGSMQHCILHLFCLDDKMHSHSHKSLPCVSYKQKYIYIYIYVTTMCFKENYCMIQQSPFVLLIARDMLTEWLLRQELTMIWAFSTETVRN